MQIIGVGYKKNRGKDTLCNLIKDCLHRTHPLLKVKKVGFADKLKDIAYQVYGWAGLQPGVYYESHYRAKEEVLPELGLTPRDIWIGIGNGLREIYNPTWIHYLTKTQLRADVILIKDMGFTNEAKEIRESGGLLLQVCRDGPMSTDAREVELDTWTDWDCLFGNRGTLHDLNLLAEDFCKEYF